MNTPKWPERIITWLCKEEYVDEILGDLEEYYFKLQQKNARFRKLRYAYHALLFLRGYALKSPFEQSNSLSMLKMNFKIALRTLRREKFYSFINISGLALGIATCLFIGLFIKDELSYDQHWENADRIFRTAAHLKLGNNEWNLANTPAPMSQAFKSDFPEIEHAGRMRNIGYTILELDQRMIKIPDMAYADQEIFDIFSFQKVTGALDLREPNTMVISQSIANRLYGDKDPVGEIVKQDGVTFKITGVYEDIPANSHFHYKLIASMENWPNSKSTEWGSNNFRTYFLLKEGVNYHELQSKFPEALARYFAPILKELSIDSWEKFQASGSLIDYYLQPLERIHLHSDLSYEIEQNGSFQYIMLFGAAGLFILIIACINFMNISTARSSLRAKEVGMRKVMGSQKRSLISQFMTESLINAFLAACIATVLVYALLPFFNHLTDKQIADPYFGKPFLFPWVLGGTVLVGFLAGCYPAFYLSSFRPVKVLKGELRLGVKSGWMRNALVITQFSASIILIFGAVVIGSQLNFIQSKSLGFNKDQVLVLHNTYTMGNKTAAFKEELKKLPSVRNVTISSYLPTEDSRSDSNLLPKSSTTGDDFVSLQIWKVDEGYVPTMDMKLIAGRNFDKNLASDSNAILLNQSAVRQFGFDHPVGEFLRTMTGYTLSGMSEFRIVGVVEDFHYDSFKESIDPMLLLNKPSTASMALRFNTENTTEMLSDVETLWNNFNPTLPLEYAFMDQQFEAKYRSEQKLSTLFTIFSGLAIFIACLGLFGLAAFTADQRKKELGIRKTLGASLPELMARQMSGYTRLLAVSITLAVPSGIYLMATWLDNFAYRTEISAMMILIPVMTVLLLAWLTVSTICYQAARQNPVENLKTE